jgi:hypothetical protein
MKNTLSSMYTVTVDGGYQEAREFMSSAGGRYGTEAFSVPQGNLCVGDASSQVPNLRASELFSACWTAYKYPNARIVTDIMVTGSIGQFSSFWGPWVPDKRSMDMWHEFYSPHKSPSRLVSLAPISNVKFENGAIASQRRKALEKFVGMLDGVSGFDSQKILERIFIVEFLSECDTSGITLGQITLNVPEGKSIGTWTCPCCNQRLSLRFKEGSYSVTESRGGPVSCWGSCAVSSQVCDSFRVADLVRCTGIELNFFASVCLHDMIGAKDSNILIRDYSNPRGSIAESLRLYGNRVRITTRNYLVGRDGDTDMSFDELCMVAERNPAKIIELMNLYPVISDGRQLILSWNG